MAEQNSDYALKIDTSLGTHLLTTVPVSFTVLDAKRKLESDHLKAYKRKMGEIRINQLKVKHMGQLYCLPDDAILADAFTGSTSSPIKSLEAEACKVGGDAAVGSEGNITNSVDATCPTAMASVSDDTKRKKKKTNKRSQSSAAQ